MCRPVTVSPNMSALGAVAGSLSMNRPWVVTPRRQNRILRLRSVYHGKQKPSCFMVILPIVLGLAHGRMETVQVTQVPRHLGQTLGHGFGGLFFERGCRDMGI